MEEDASAESYENNGKPGPDKPDVLSQLKCEYMREKTQKLKNEILDGLDSQLDDMLEEFVQEVETYDHLTPPAANGEIRNQKITRNIHHLPDKVFVARHSVLTELFEISHIQTIYHIFVAILICFSLNTIVYDFLDKGKDSFSEAWQTHGFSLVLDFDLVYWAFGRWSTSLTLWLYMIVCTMLVYPCFYYWSNLRQPGKINTFDIVCLIAYVVYQGLFMYYPCKIVFQEELPPASAAIIVTEQTRLLMKVHAFVRQNIPRAMKYKPHSDQDNGPCPDFTCFLYFLFAPTLVYRDSYPRTKYIRWKYVVSNFAQVFACILYVYYLMARFCVPIFRHFNADHVTPRELLVSVFGCMLPGSLVLFIGFFCVLHSWLNAFAEMLRFGDRLFYKDWWNSSHFSNYYRTWNVVVHDWLYCYVYKDIYIVTNNRVVSMVSVFTLSAVFHEYILTVMLGYFYPVLFVMFGVIGFGLMFVPKCPKSRLLNVAMWVGLFTGMGLLMCMYSMEWFARKNCQPTTDSFLDYLIPRSWTCDIKFTKI